MSRSTRIFILGLTAALFLGAAALAWTVTDRFWVSATTFLLIVLLGSVALFVTKAVFEAASKTENLTRQLQSNTTQLSNARSHDKERFSQLQQGAAELNRRTETSFGKLSSDLDQIRVSKAEHEKLTAERISTINGQIESHGELISTSQAQSNQLRSELDQLETRIASFNGRIRKLEREFSSGLVHGNLAASGLTGQHPDDQSETPAGLPITNPAAVAQIVLDIESGQIPLEHVSDDFPDDVVGLSGRRFRTLVSKLVENLGEHGDYLEIGTYRGKTLCTSALLNPGVRHVGVDNFSFEGDHNRKIFEDLVDSFGLSNIDFYEDNFFDWLVAKAETRSRDVAVYYFDASHDYRSQFLALLYGAKVTATGGVMLVDDCNYSHVRAATYDFCELHPDWALLFERYTQGHPNRASDEVRAEMSEGWWNGVHVLVHDPDHQLQRLERQKQPTVERFFLDQHRIENCVTDAVVSRLAGPSQ